MTLRANHIRPRIAKGASEAKSFPSRESGVKLASPPRGGSRRRPGSRRRRPSSSRGRRSSQRGRPAAGTGAPSPSDSHESAGRRAEEIVDPKSKELELPERLTVRELANKMGCSPIELIKELMNAGIMANINQQIDYDTAAIVAEDMGYTVQELKPPEPEIQVEEAPAQPVRRRVYSEEEQKHLRKRPPVVTILGHVDHGKTSLLDVIRQTNVQEEEAGGITQHIGAYQIRADGKRITFLDTPGHEAFTAMRARGASATDIAVLVVAADDGVQPQTREAIDHARAAQVPIIVAINKIDLMTANPDHVKQQLADLGLVAEDWGGDTICVLVSAKTKEGIEALLEMILLVAEMAELKANPQRKAEGVVLEGKLDRSRGSMATLLVQEGILKVGDVLLIGQTYGKIRAMFDHQGKQRKRATPSMPAVVIGLRQVPQAGDRFQVLDSEREARELAEQRGLELADKAARPIEALSLEDLYAQAQAGDVQALNLILKADAQGSIEPIKNSLEKIDVGDLKVKFIHDGVGNIGEADIMLAVASQAIVIGFNVDVDASTRRLAEAEGVSIRTYDIIYRVVEDVQLALTGMLEPEYEEVIHGRAIIRQVFRSSRLGAVAGVQVLEGKALRNSMIRVKRGEEQVFDGQVSSLKRYTEDVREVTIGMECGVGIDGFKAYEEGDILEFHTQELKQ